MEIEPWIDSYAASKDEGKRAAAADALGNSGTSEALNKLYKMLLKEEDAWTLELMLHCLHDVGTAESAELWERLELELSSPDQLAVLANFGQHPEPLDD